MNTILVILIVVGLAIVWLMQQKTLKKAKAVVGKPAPDGGEIYTGERNFSGVYYFHALHCGPCRKITPFVEKMQHEHDNLLKVDIGEHQQLAHAFHIVATPSFVAVKDGIICEVKVGAVGPSWLRRHLA